MNINLDPDTFKILVFIIIVVMVLLFLSIIGTSFKNSSVTQKTEEQIVWGNQLLITLLLFSFVYVSYTSENLYLFISALVLVILMVL
jgi:hypothetical protein